MKYSINGFSQAEITKFNDSHPDLQIDPVDLLIFAWLKDFVVDTEIAATANKSRKRMWTKEIEGTRYYRVMYSALIEEFPILNYQSQKTISRRFEKYVEAGILLKKVISAGQGKGSYTYFALTALFQSFYTDKTNPEQKINPHSSNNDSKSNANGNSSVDFREDKNVFSKSEEQLGEDKNVRSFKYILQPNLNSPATSVPERAKSTENQPQDETAEAAYLKTLEKLFGFNPSFSPNPYPRLVELLRKYGISEEQTGEYLEWAFNSIRPNCKDQTKLHCYFFKTFTQESYIANFSKIQQQRKSVELQKIRCPVCGTFHSKNDLSCPNKDCNFERESAKNVSAVRDAKKVYFLKTQKPAEYERMEHELSELMERFPITKRFLNKNMNSEFLAMYEKIRSKYLSGINVS